jgi:hypothetical protein
MAMNHELIQRQVTVSNGRDRRKLHRTARRHNRLTLGDRLAYWRAVGWSRGRATPGWPLWLRLSLTLVVLGLAAVALLV